MLREYQIGIKVRNKKLDFVNLVFTISKSLGIPLKDIIPLREIEYTDGGYNVKEFEEQ